MSGNVMDSEVIWQAAKEELSLQMNRGAFNTWLKDAELLSADSSEWVISVKTPHARDWLENRLIAKIQHTIKGISGDEPALKFVVNEPTPPPKPRIAKSLSRKAEKTEPRPVAPPSNGKVVDKSAHLNNRYTFSTFIVGSNNRLVHAASLAVAESPGQNYNPLFIYGGVGLGKTHLLHAIGHRCREHGLHVCYVSCETFTNDLIEAIKRGKTAQFRDKYRTPDVLLLDDIQFIAGKESTQEELFHTFNDLHSREKQLVLSSDRSPRSMVTLEERLRSRFEWGLMADIQLPDEETRLAILQSKAEENNINIPDEILQMIARNVRRNIRQLEGSLIKLAAYANLTGRTIDEDLVNMALSDLMGKSEKVSVEQVVSTVSTYYSVTVEQLRGKGRSRAISYPRQVAMYLCRTETDASFPVVGKYLGNRDHTTVMHGHDKIAKRIDTDEALRRDVLELKALLFESGS